MATKLGADAFLYLTPVPGVDDFAQCSSCCMWVQEDDRCTIHGPHVRVSGSMSCGLYINGEPQLPGTDVEAIVSPVESGLVDREVRCENCRHSGGDVCGLFETLNSEMPDLFEIDTEIEPKGCCNAQQPRET